MKSILRNALALLVFVIFAGSCGNKEESQLGEKEFSILEFNAGDCKGNLKSTNESQYIELKAEGSGRLNIKFVNAVFNCCPGKITSSASFQNGILKIVFAEEMGACDCICDYDVECLIGSIANGDYDIEVYINNTEEPKASFSFTYSSQLDMTYNIDQE